MRTLVCLGLLVPALLLAVSLEPTTVVPAEGPAQAGPPVKPATGRSGPGQPGRFTLGVVDTVGGTTYDWQANGPALKLISNTPGAGVHVLWMHSVETQGTSFPDRNMRYNFYDYGNRSWNWIDPDYMQSGVGVFSDRTGFGNLEADPNTGVAVISAHHATGSLAPVVARDVASGAGIFEYCPGEPTIDDNAWPAVRVGSNGYYQMAMIDYTSQDNLFWSRATSWCNWDPEVSVPGQAPEPLFPDHNIAASQVPGRADVCITWVNSPDGFGVKPGYYRLSTDGGDNWGLSTELPLPATFTPGSETVPSFHITSLYPIYDMDNQLHIAAAVEPVVNDTNHWLPVELWHWCEASPNTWALIHRTPDPETIAAPIGYNAIQACRPSLGQDTMGNLFVAWEEFDCVNHTPLPVPRLRAEIWYSHSSDNGQTWAPAEKITDTDTNTYRFPCILDRITDTVMVSYLCDYATGFFLYNEGGATPNPILVQKWRNPYVTGGVASPGHAAPRRVTVSANPNPFTRTTHLTYAVPWRGHTELAVFDAAGRPVRTLVSRRCEPGRYNAVWDGRGDDGGQVPAGVYLYRLTLDTKRVTGKLTLTR